MENVIVAKFWSQAHESFTIILCAFLYINLSYKQWGKFLSKKEGFYGLYLTLWNKNTKLGQLQRM